MPRTPNMRAWSAQGSSRASCSRSPSWSALRTTHTWLGALESLRLVLGTQLDVTEESYGPLDLDDPEAARLALYHWLSWLQEEVVQALSASLPEGRNE